MRERQRKNYQEILPFVQRILDTTVNDQTKLSPAQLVYGNAQLVYGMQLVWMTEHLFHGGI